MRPTSLPAVFFVLAVVPTIAKEKCARGPASARQVLTHHLDLTMREALALDGRRGNFRVVLDSLLDDYDGQTLYDCLTPASASSPTRQNGQRRVGTWVMLT